MSNQMFQMAAIFALSQRNKATCGFSLETCYTPLQGFSATKYADNIFKRIPRLPEGNQFKYSYREPKFTYRELPFQDDCLYEGFFQSPKYWNGHIDEVKSLFDVPPITELDCSNLTAVHIRRGDFLNHPEIYNILPVDYYELAMQKTGGPFIFVSDDLPWVKENFKWNSSIYYSPFDNEIDDFRLIASCKNVIAGNSTFSLIGGILNPNKGIRVCPGGDRYPWFNNHLDSRDMAPKDWIKL